MDRFKRILVAAAPGHLEPLTMHAAVHLAKVNEAHLSVIDVLPPVPRLRRKIEVEGRVVDLESALLQDRQERVRHLVENAGAPPNTSVAVKVGEPFLEVIRHALVHHDDLVMVGGQEVPPGEVPNLSSGIMHLMRKCPVPVWMMRPRQASTLRILALVDPDPGDAVRDSLNDLVLELALSLADRESAELHVGHAWTLQGEATLRSSPYVSLPGAMVDAMVSSVEELHREQLDRLAAHHGLDRHATSFHVISGDPHEVLPRLADRLDVGLIVMGTVARTGLSGLIMGNTAETILRAVRCSVLAVKPTGFTTPVKIRRSVRAEAAGGQ